MLVEASTFVVRIIHYFANLIAQDVQEKETHCLPDTMCVVTGHGWRYSFFMQGSLDG